jgi:hypothetical protein
MSSDLAEKKISRAEARRLRKEVRTSAAAPEPIDDKQFKWSAADIDHSYTGAWDWNLAPKEAADLLSLLEETSKLNWREVRQLTAGKHRRHHDQTVESLCAEAQDRLEALQLDLETIFRLRHGSLPRVWGHIQNAVFRIIWYDRSHRVYPTEPD